MPLDPSIILGAQPAPLQSPLQGISAIAQLQDVQAQVEQRRQAGEAARQKAMDDAQVRSVFAAAGGDTDAALKQLYLVNPRAAAPLAEQVGKARKEQLDAMGKDLDNQKKTLEHYTNIWGLVSDDASLGAIRPLFVKAFPQLDPVLPKEYGDGSAVQRVSDLALSQKDKVEQNQKVMELFAKGEYHAALGNVLSRPDITPAKWDEAITGAIKLGVPKAVADEFGGVGGFSPANVANAARLAIPAAKRAELEGQAATREQNAHSPAYKEWTDYQAQGGPLDFNAYMTMDANRKAVHMRINAGQATGDDLKETIAGMKDGTLPPALPGRGSAAYTGLMAEAHRQGFDLASAATDWTAAQGHFKTLNGAQQTRLRQAVDTAGHSLDVIDTLAGQWKGGRFPVLNRANLALAKNGAYGPDVATTARQLDAQIADVTAELANAYMGGNSPTDHALELAAKNLSSDWSEKTLKDMTALARTNLKIRQNAIKNVGAIGASEVNPYVPTAPAATPKRYNPKTGKVE